MGVHVQGCVTVSLLQVHSVILIQLFVPNRPPTLFSQIRNIVKHKDVKEISGVSFSLYIIYGLVALLIVWLNFTHNHKYPFSTIISDLYLYICNYLVVNCSKPLNSGFVKLFAASDPKIN